MKKYFLNINQQSNGDYEVHTEDCRYVPSVYNRIDLGYHSNCESAMREAKRYRSQVDGCYHCCYPCHKQ